MHMDLQVDSVHAGHRGSAPLRFDMAIRWRSLAADSPLSRTHDDPLLGDVHCSNTCLAASIHGHCGMPKVPGLTKPRFASAGMHWNGRCLETFASALGARRCYSAAMLPAGGTSSTDSLDIASNKI